MIAVESSSIERFSTLGSVVSRALYTSPSAAFHLPGVLLMGDGVGDLALQDLAVGSILTLGSSDGWVLTLGDILGLKEGWSEVLGKFEGQVLGSILVTLGSSDGWVLILGFSDEDKLGRPLTLGVVLGELELLLMMQRQQTSLALSSPGIARSAAAAPHKPGST